MPLAAFVVGINRAHGVVGHHVALGILAIFRQFGPTRLLRNPEDVFGRVFVAVLRIRAGVSGQFVPETLKRLRNIPQEDHPEGHILVIAGVHVAPTSCPLR